MEVGGKKTGESGPSIYSLDQYEVPIPQETLDMLTKQFGDDSVGTKMNKIRRSLKIPPSTTVCRVNWIQCTTREELIGDLEQSLQQWKNELGVGVSIEPHGELEDVILLNVRSSLHPPISCPPSEGAPLFTSWPQRAQLGWTMHYRVILVDRFCGEAVLRGSDIFVKGILVADVGIMHNETLAVYVHVGDKPPSRGSRLDAYHRGGCVFVGLGKSKCTRAEIFSRDKGVAVRMTAQRACPVLPPLHGVPKMRLQNLPSIMVAHALDPKPGEVVLDMCCAPGGKTSHLASLMRNEGVIVACDKSRRKVLATQQLLQSEGATCVTALALDTTKCVLSTDAGIEVQETLSRAKPSDDDGLLEIQGFAPASFDRILLDPPCSALGLRPKLKIDIKCKELRKQADYQMDFFRSAIRLLKPGGTMTYSTCTINALENEGVVARVLAEFDEVVELIPLGVGRGGHKGLAGHGLGDRERSLVRRFDPSDEQDDCMGFFIAKLRKRRKGL